MSSAGGQRPPGVVPAKAGTHTPRPVVLAVWQTAFVTTGFSGYGSPLSRGRRELKSGDAAVQIILIRALDFRRDDFTCAQRAAARDIDRAVDLGRVRLRTSPRNGGADLVDDDLLPGSDLALQPAG